MFVIIPLDQTVVKYFFRFFPNYPKKDYSAHKTIFFL